MINEIPFLNLRSVPCPLNVVKCKLALEKLSHKDKILIDLDKGEPEVMVKKTLSDLGFKLKLIEDKSNWIRLEISYAID